MGLGNLPWVSTGLVLLTLRASTWFRLSAAIGSVEQSGETLREDEDPFCVKEAKCWGADPAVYTPVAGEG